MHYGFDESELAARDGLREVLSSSLEPARLAALETGQRELARELSDELVEGGWFAAFTDPDAGISMPGQVLLGEELGRCLATVPWTTQLGFIAGILAGHESGAAAELRTGIDDGEFVTAWLQVDPRDRTRPAALPRGDRLDGRLAHVPIGDGEGTLLVPVLDASGAVAIALVDLISTGVSVERTPTVDLTQNLATVILSSVEPVGVIEPDAPQLSSAWLRYLVLIAAESVGGMQEVLDRSVRYATEREQFGVAIGTFQAIKHKLADLSTSLENARTLTYLAADSLDARGADAAGDVWMARSYAANAYLKACGDAIQAHGGIGFTWEAQVHLWYRNALDTVSRSLGSVDSRSLVLAP